MVALVNDQIGDFSCMVASAVALVTTSALIMSSCVRRHAAMRHCILLVALLCSLLTPLVSCVLVTADRSFIEISLLSSEVDSQRIAAASMDGGASNNDRYSELDRLSRRESPAANSAYSPNAQIKRAPAVSSIVLLTWFFGVACLVLRFLWGLVRLRRLRQSCQPIVKGEVRTALSDAARRLGAEGEPDIVSSRHVLAPVVIGLFRSVIVLPENCCSIIGQVALSNVLVHEMAHVVRRDNLVLLLEFVARTLFWPIPTLHLVNRSLDIAREDVCDNYVLRDQDAVRFGETLARLGEFAHGRDWLRPSMGILHRGGKLEGRVLRLLDTRRNTMTQLNRPTALALLLLFLFGTVVLCGTTIVAAQMPRNTTAEKLEDGFSPKLKKSAAVLSQGLADHNSYAIEPSDVLRLEIIGIALTPNSVDGERTVNPDGTISLGAYGTVNLNGMSVPEARTAIKNFLVSRAASQGDVAVCLEVVAHDSKACYIVVHDERGEHVSRIRWNANETVAAAVLRVEGLAATAAKDGIWIARPLARSMRTLAVDWRAITQDGRLATNHKLEPRDRIFVGQSPSKWRDSNTDDHSH